MRELYLILYLVFSVASPLFSNGAQAARILECEDIEKNPGYKLKSVSLSGGYEKILLTGTDGTRREYLVEGVQKIPVGNDMALFGSLISELGGMRQDNVTLVPDDHFQMYSVRAGDRSIASENTALFFDHQTPSLEEIDLKTGRRTRNRESKEGSIYFNCENFPGYLEDLENHYPGKVSDDWRIQKAAARFASAYIDHNLAFENQFLGVEIWQNPFDMWVIQQMITELKPDVIVETGTAHAGSALFLATILEKINPNGRVITVEHDPDVEKNIKKAGRFPIFSQMVSVVEGDSVSADTIRQIQSLVDEVKEEKRDRNRSGGGREFVILVTLDTLHSAKHVLKELELYSEFVSPGSYIVVQDTIIDQKKKYFDWFVRPWTEGAVAGPGQAVRVFLAGNGDFQRDSRWEKYFFTFYHGGFLKRLR